MRHRADLRPRGTIEWYLRHHGRVIERGRSRNMVLAAAQETLARLLGGELEPVTLFGVGTNGLGPSPGDLALTGEVLTPIVLVSYPAAGQVSFGWEVGTDDANGLTIREFGLVTATGTLIARKTRASGIEKTAAITISGTWTLTF